MFFILATFSLLLTNGFNFNLDEEKLEVQEHAEKSLVEMKDHVKSKITQYVLISSKAVLAFQKKNPALLIHSPSSLNMVIAYLIISHEA